MAVKFLDKTGLSHFWSKIKAWCNVTFAAITHSHAWSTITGKPTTISGYGITDAKIASGTITLGSNSITPLTSHQDISGKVNKSGDTMTGNLEITKSNYPSLSQKDTDTTGTHIDFTHRNSSATALFNIRTYTGETQLGRKRDAGGSWYEGSEIILHGSGDTTIKTNNGTNAYTLVAKASSSGELVWTGIQSRMAYGNYGVIFRNDGSTFYLLKTASGSAASGSWDSTRPLTVNLSTGVCSINGNAATATKATQDSDGNAINSTYLKLSGGTMTGNIVLKKSNITRGSSTTAVTCDFLDIKDSASNRISCYSILYYANKSSETNIYAYNTTASSGGNIGYIGIGCNSSGTVYTHAPTPATSSNDTNIATTAFVKAQGYTTATGHTHSYLPLGGGTLTGNLYGTSIVFNNTLAKQHPSITKGTVPSSGTYYWTLNFADKNGMDYTKNTLAQLESRIGTDNKVYFYMRALKNTANTTTNAEMGVIYDTNNSTGWAYCPTPASNANDTRIATTKWVNDKGYLTSHQSLSNYVTLNTAQNNITGAKRFVNSIGMDFAEDYYNNNPSTGVYRSLNVQEKTHKYTMADILYANNAGSSATWILRLGLSAAVNSFFGVYESNSDAYCVSYFDIIPSTSGNDSCGRSSRKWDKVWATTGTIQTSDKRLKEDIIDIPDAVLDVWEDISWKQFKLKKSIKEKGSELARIHSGVIAQDIQELFSKVNIDCGKYGFFCYDEWNAEEARYDDDGNLLMPALEADSQYSIRYEEALCIEAAYQRRKNKILENRISELEKRLAKLEGVV